MACMYIHYATAVTIGVTTGCRLCILLVHVLTTGVTTGRHTVTLRPYVIPVCGMLHCGQDKQAVWGEAATICPRLLQVNL